MTDDEFIIYRCTECGKVFNGYGAIGALHGHAERHRPFLASLLNGGKVEELMDYTERLQVTEYDELDPVPDDFHDETLADVIRWLGRQVIRRVIPTK